MKICSIDGCGKRAESRGWCGKHYQLWRRNGEPSKLVRGTEKALRFLNEHKDYAGDECLLWPFRKDVQIIVDGRGRYAWTVMLEISQGPRPSPGHQCYRSCGNKLCVNPRHLRWSNKRKNRRQMMLDGRAPRAILKPSDVPEIRKLIGLGVKQTEIAKRFGVSIALICRIKSGERWGWL